MPILHASSRVPFLLVAAGLIGLGSADPARAQPAGAFDPGFGTAGIVEVEATGGARVAALDDSGRLVIAGESGGGDVAVRRLLPDGTVDTAFGTDGVALIDFGDELDFASAIAFAPDGRIVVAGAAASVNIVQGGVARLLPDGQLDEAFGSGGRVLVEGFIESKLSAVRVLPGGTVAVAGFARPFTFDTGAVVAHYTDDGALDASFGVGGIAYAVVSAEESFNSFDGLIEPDGSVVLGGAVATIVLEEVEPVVVALQADGALDTSFGAGGIASFSAGQAFSLLYALARDERGRLVGGGFSLLDGTEIFEALVVRLETDGTLDPSFGTGGIVSAQLGESFSRVQDLAVQQGGAIVLGADAGSRAQPAFTVVRLDESGAVDASFGDGGTVAVLPALIGRADQVVLQPDGKIVAAGTVSEPGTQRPVVVRLQGDASVGTEESVAAAASGLRFAGPNPARASTSVLLTSPRARPARVAVYDLAGREVAVVHDGPVAAGETVFDVPLGGVAPGLYVVRASGGAVASLRLVRL